MTLDMTPEVRIVLDEGLLHLLGMECPSHDEEVAARMCQALLARGDATIELTPEVQEVLAEGLRRIEVSEVASTLDRMAGRTCRKRLAALGLAASNGTMGTLHTVRVAWVRDADGRPKRVSKDGSGIWRGTKMAGGRREEVHGVPVYLDEDLDIEVG